MELNKLKEQFKSYRANSVSALNEWEGYQLLKGTGIELPKSAFVSKQEWSTCGLPTFDASKLVLKIVSRKILHKSDWGGVAFVPNEASSIRDAMTKMAEKAKETSWDGFLLMERVAFDRSLGHEWLLGFRKTRDFGPVVVLGPGGIYTEYLAKSFESEHLLSVFSPHLHKSPQDVLATLKENALIPLISGGLRGQEAEVDLGYFSELIFKFLERCCEFEVLGLDDLELNPVVISEGKVVALDALAKLGRGEETPIPQRPIHKIENLLKPRTVGLIGVSEKMNPGKIILLNLLKCGFEAEHITIVKPGVESIEGCRCVPDIASMPNCVDLMVLSISAQQVPDVMCDLMSHQKAESVILIPGGLEEKAGTRHLVAKMKEQLHAERGTDWQGPVINGGNCVGVRSTPGKYDTLFIPRHKMAPAGDVPANLAFISQSGAYLVSLLDRLTDIAPLYSVSLGNQTDLTICDYIEYLEDDPQVKVLGIYCEGLKPGDGARLLASAARLKEQGRRIVFYHAGRTPEGAAASASHTASVAGNYKIFAALARQVGVVVAESLRDFEDLTRLVYNLQGHSLKGNAIGAISNAGFECVAIADQLGPFELGSFSESTCEGLQACFEKARIGEIVDVHNPLDLTPMMNDAGYEYVMDALLADEQIDAGVFGIVPLTPALNSLQKADHHREDISDERSIVQRLARLKESSQKPFIVVVDAGEAYEPMRAELTRAGIPVFGKMDRAMRLFGIYARAVMISA